MSMVTGRRILVVESNPLGHRLYYVRLIVEEILARGDSAVIATSLTGSETAEWKLHMSSLEGQIEVLERTCFSFAMITDLAKEVAAQHVVIPDGDTLALEIGRRRTWSSDFSISLLVMRERGQPFPIPGVASVKGTIKKILLFSANQVQGVRVCILKSSLWKGRSFLTIARDPVTLAGSVIERQTSADSWQLDSNRYWFGVLGAVTSRKNLPLVVEAISRLSSLNIGLVVAGKVAEDVWDALPQLREVLTRKAIPLVVHNRLLDDLELDSLVSAVDCVVLAHSNEGSSGIMGKAAVSGTRVVAAGARSLRTDCRANPSLSVWAPLDVVALAKVLEHTSSLARPAPIGGISSRDFASVLI